MSRFAFQTAALIFFFAAAGVGVCAASAQSPAPAASPAPDAGQAAVQPSAANCPPSTTLDEMIKALDDAVSGPGDKDRTCLRDLLVPDARLSPIVKASDGTFAPQILTVDAWIDAVKARGSGVFYERQTKYTTDTFGHIAHLWSTYELRLSREGKVEIRGINSIQAVFDGSRWRVFEILWQAETPADPVPAKYLH